MAARALGRGERRWTIFSGRICIDRIAEGWINAGMLKATLKAAWHRLPFKLPILRVLRATMRLPEGMYRHLHFHGDFDVEVAPGARFCIRSYASGGK
jgi:hypothetical protein